MLSCEFPLWVCDTTTAPLCPLWPGAPQHSAAEARSKSRFRASLGMTGLPRCHPERSEGSAFLRWARRSWRLAGRVATVSVLLTGFLHPEKPTVGKAPTTHFQSFFNTLASEFRATAAVTMQEEDGKRREDPQWREIVQQAAAT